MGLRRRKAIKDDAHRDLARDREEFAPGETWDVVMGIVGAAHRRDPDEFRKAVEVQTLGRASLDHNCQRLSIFCFGLALTEMLGDKPTESQITAVAQRIEPDLLIFMRANRWDAEEVIRRIYMPSPASEHQTARLAILGAAICGVIVQDPLRFFEAHRRGALEATARWLAKGTPAEA
jgi:hypothetical protein